MSKCNCCICPEDECTDESECFLQIPSNVLRECTRYDSNVMAGDLNAIGNNPIRNIVDNLREDVRSQ